MTQITLNLPDDIVSDRGNSLAEFARRMQLAAAIYWYSRSEISQGKAAQLAGVSRKKFLEALALENVDVFQVDFEDLSEELARG